MLSSLDKKSMRSSLSLKITFTSNAEQTAPSLFDTGSVTTQASNQAFN